MDLYQISGTYLGTQADARAEAKAQGVRFDPAEHSIKVPTDKAGLIQFLNERRQPPLALLGVSAAIAPPGAETPPLPSARTASPIDAIDAFKGLSPAEKLIALEEAIQSARGPMLASLIGNAVCRLEELRRELPAA